MVILFKSKAEQNTHIVCCALLSPSYESLFDNLSFVNEKLICWRKDSLFLSSCCLPALYTFSFPRVQVGHATRFFLPTTIRRVEIIYRVPDSLRLLFNAESVTMVIYGLFSLCSVSRILESREIFFLREKRRFLIEIRRHLGPQGFCGLGKRLSHLFLLFRLFIIL